MIGSRRTTAATVPAPLTQLLGLMRDGVVLVDRDRRVSYLNRVASHRLGLGTPVLTGARPFETPASTETVEVELEFDGEPYTAIIVRDETDPVALDHDRLAAFARTAARAACMGSLQSTLDAVAAEVLHVTAAVTCTVAVTDEHGEISVVGAAGDPREHLARVRDAMRLGAPMLSLAAAHRRTPRVERDLRARTRDDVRFKPLAPIVEKGHWRSLVAVPLVAREVSLGALTAFYPEPADPDEAEVAFIGAMADQAAIAVNTARLFTEAEAKATLEERNRLARDLHDSVSQNLYSLVLQTRAAQSAAARIEGPDGTMMTERLRTLHRLAEAALGDMRSAITHLRAPTTMGDSGLAVAVREHAAAVADRDAVTISVAVPDEPLLLSLEAEHELFRVITEALANSIRHANPTDVQIRIAQPGDSNELVVTITDNGAGFDLAHHRPGHVGLQSMRERAERLGGRLTVESSEQGTTVRAVVPCRRWPTRDDRR
jgi:signal transduction histidine kinase